MNPDPITVVRYKTCRACFEAYLGCSVDEAKAVKGHYQDGKPYQYPAKEFLKSCRLKGYWGWSNKRFNSIHIWVGKKASFEQVVRLFAHERGHHMRPWHKGSKKEEMKAGLYEEVAAFAASMAVLIESEELTVGTHTVERV